MTSEHWTDVYTGVGPLIRNTCLMFVHFWFRVTLLWVLEIAMGCSRHNGSNHPFRQTQLVEMVMWQVQYVKK